jgi:transcriptional regulator with XRE-family HTH domain
VGTAAAFHRRRQNSEGAVPYTGGGMARQSGTTTRAGKRTSERRANSSRRNDHPARLAATLRKLRREKGLSLQEVADATSISASFLSLVENGKSDITIGRLVRLANFYGITLIDLVPPAHAAEPEVTRVAERRHIFSPAEGIDVHLLTPDTNRTMMPMVVEFRPGAELAEFGQHDDGEEWILVEEGRLCLILEGVEPRHMGPGDSAYYRANQPHLFRNDSTTEPLRIICVNTPPL